MHKKVLFILFMALSACCCRNSGDIDTIAERHSAKLRRHFLGDNTVDVSTLISETRAISAKLKRAGMNKKGNKFDSYIDVLTYGNNTIDESLNDVMELVKRKNCVCPTLQNIKTELFCGGS